MREPGSQFKMRMMSIIGDTVVRNDEFNLVTILDDFPVSIYFQAGQYSSAGHFMVARGHHNKPNRRERILRLESYFFSKRAHSSPWLQNSLHELPLAHPSSGVRDIEAQGVIFDRRGQTMQVLDIS